MNRRCALVVVAVILLGAAQVAYAQVEWTMHQLVVQPGDPGEWDEGGHMLGSVLFDGALYHMYVGGGHGTDPLNDSWSVGHWSSPDVTGPWAEDPANPVLEPTPGSWDGYSIYKLAVHFDGAMFHMWYGAVTELRGVVNVGYATNLTGSGDWTKAAGPLPGLGPGNPGEWDDYGTIPDTVLLDGTNLQMWFTAIGSGGHYWGTWRIGHATSTDGGLSWVKDPGSWVLEGSGPWEGIHVYKPEVVPYGIGFAMWYVGNDLTSAKIGHAMSSVGVTWTKWLDNPVLLPWVAGCGVDSIAVVLEGHTAHGWVSHCNDIWYTTSPLFEVLFFDGFESGSTTLWSLTVP